MCFWSTKAKNHTCQQCDDEFDRITSPFCMVLAQADNITEFWCLQPQPSPCPVSASWRWSMCHEPVMKPASRRWVRWTLVRWCHLQWAPMTGPSCFGALSHTLQHLSEADLAHTTAAQIRACCSQGFYYSPVMKPTEVKWGRRSISSRARFHSISLAENVL